MQNKETEQTQETVEIDNSLMITTTVGVLGAAYKYLSRAPTSGLGEAEELVFATQEIKRLILSTVENADASD